MSWTDLPDGPGYYFVYGRNLDYDNIIGPYYEGAEKDRIRSKCLIVEYTPEQWGENSSNVTNEGWVHLLSQSYRDISNLPIKHIQKWWKITMPENVAVTEVRPDQSILDERYPVLSPELTKKLLKLSDKCSALRGWINETFSDEDRDTVEGFDDEASSVIQNVGEYLGECCSPISYAVSRSQDHAKKRKQK